MLDKPLSNQTKMSSKKSERFYFRSTRLLDDDPNFFEACSVKWSKYCGYHMTGWVDLDSPKHALIKQASKAYGVEFIPQKMFLDKYENN